MQGSRPPGQKLFCKAFFRTIVLLLLLTPGIISGQPSLTGTLTGTVTSAYTGLPIAGASVICPPLIVTTNIQGQYTMLNVPVGTNTVTCAAVGYIANTGIVTINVNQTTVYNCSLYPTPATITGIVYDSATHDPIVGAKVWISFPFNTNTYSTIGGVYFLHIYPGGTSMLQCAKTGYDNYYSGPVTMTPQNTIVKNIPLLSHAYSPDSVTAGVDAGGNMVITFTEPYGDYELLYDDGTDENFTCWSVAGNMNAVKFTPKGYPAMVFGGNAPDAAGIAIDEDDIQFHSYSRFAIGGGPWVPVGGNLMMRAYINSQGGP